MLTNDELREELKKNNHETPSTDCHSRVTNQSLCDQESGVGQSAPDIDRPTAATGDGGKDMTGQGSVIGHTFSSAHSEHSEQNTDQIPVSYTHLTLPTKA